MSKFGDLIRGGAPAPTPAPAPEPVVEVTERPDLGEDTTSYEEVVLEDMSKDELEEYGRTLGIELDKRRSKETLIEELREAEGE